jgi:hypothetical protein
MASETRRGFLLNITVLDTKQRSIRRVVKNTLKYHLYILIRLNAMKKIDEIIVRNADKPLRLTLVLATPLVTAFAVLISIFYIWDHQSRQRHLELQLKETAKAHFDQIVLSRLWNARHGGVYVEVTEETPPNPYLDDPEKNIVSQSGKMYTKLNPAYMTRQLSELAEEFKAFEVRITGLHPKNPSNSPDHWEENMIRSFWRGKDEAYVIMKRDGKSYFRYMGPLFVEDECLRCHSAEGYNVGDIKGGISVSIPTDLLATIEKYLDRRSLLAFGTIGIFAISLLVGTTWYSSKRLGEGLRMKLEGERLETAIKIAAAAAHELRQPMTIISGFSELLKDKANRGEDITQETKLIINQCDRMNAIITRMLNVTAYRTKAYGGTTEIFDLGVNSEEEEKS